MKSPLAVLLVVLATALPVAAQPGTMATFDGIDDHLVISDGPYRAQVTLEFWVKPDSHNQTLAIRTNGSGFEAGQWSNLLSIRADGRLEYKILDDMTGGIEWNYSVATLTGTAVLTVGQWVHVAAVAENGLPGTMRLYINGQLDAVSSNFNRSWTGGDRWHIGTTVSSGLPKLAGSVDEIRLWSEARTQAQIQSAYAVPTSTTAVADARFTLLVGIGVPTDTPEPDTRHFALVQNYPNPFNPSTVIGCP